MRIEKIHFNYLTTKFFFPNRTALKNFILFLFKKEGVVADRITYIFCSDAYLLEINKKHLNHNTYTDIITFQFSPKKEPVLSDIYISIDRVKENAKTFKTTFERELLRVIFHGVLHLCDYNDKTIEQARQMRIKEEFYLNRFLVSRGTN